eukprot:CAMPEP_0183298596 /NCGR_PEP_ID=MMETSP0160_2-20130417/5573_1 /TAXON_ID=2839 ORGANISM="Odontella Sinensis, Strain Grunow 1884" /NCGR_SAMPLE_ID=MMETSP0160_2 /ASSEMBLY_ACC=CAM_ASM_000250 /LENGTH=142 /DNA_ID=CAMNT_0025460669 /DNA_START=233 /DNA_END=662 /DNA_ORIENTATION=+
MVNFSASKQFVKPPQRGIFPLDHDSECKPAMEAYLECLQSSRSQHHKCRELSKEYLQCRMDNQLMAREDLNDMGYSDDAAVKGDEVKEYDKSKERGGYVAGKHMTEGPSGGSSLGRTDADATVNEEQRMAGGGGGGGASEEI